MKKRQIHNNKKNEGHGWLDGITSGEELKRIPLCRFRYPLFPMDVTTLIVGLDRETDEEVVTARKKDLRKLLTFLIRQTLGGCRPSLACNFIILSISLTTLFRQDWVRKARVTYLL